MKSPLASEYAKIFEPYPWEWFVTLTFVNHPHPEAALKKWRVWVSKINRELFGPRWSKKDHGGVAWVACIEYQKRGAIHIHALMFRTGLLRRLTWMDAWHELDATTGFARIEPIKSIEKSTSYVCKYVAKEGELFLSDNLGPVQGDMLRTFDPR